MSVDLAERGESPAASECPHVDVLLLWRRREVGVGSLEKLFNCERVQEFFKQKKIVTDVSKKSKRRVIYNKTGDSAVYLSFTSTQWQINSAILN